MPDSSGPGSAGGESTKWIQQRLVALGYLPSPAVTGHLGPWTRGAVIAFQGWEKLARDGIPGPATISRLRTAKRPTPKAGTGKRIEVYLTAQVALLATGNRVDRVIKVSTGAPGYATPAGNYDLPQTPQGLVLPLQRVAAVRELLQRRHRLPRIT